MLIFSVKSWSGSSQSKQNNLVRPYWQRMFTFVALMLLCCFAFQAVAQQQGEVISEIRVIGNRKIPKETVLARLFSRIGDTYDPASVERDFNSLWNTGYFSRRPH